MLKTATDIAFSLGILALLGSRIPVSLKMFLTALAIFDDIGAIVVIAIFYTQHISVLLLLVASCLVLLLIVLNRFGVCSLIPYFLVGGALWLVVLKSGVHATLSGIILALAIPLENKNNPEKSPLRDLERKLHPWVAFVILPLFAFANAGVSFDGVTMKELFGPITLGVALGLFVGKQIGIWGASMIAIKAGITRFPRHSNGWQIYGISLIAGVGFTMSLFIGSLAFGKDVGTYPAQVRLGVIAGSFLAGALGYLVLRICCRKNKKKLLNYATSSN